MRKRAFLIFMLLLAAGCTSDWGYSGAGLSFNYPAGWSVGEGDSETGVTLASDHSLLAFDSALDGPPAGEALINVLVLRGQSAADVLASMTGAVSLSEGAPQFGDPAEVTAGERTVLRASGSGERIDAMVTVVDLEPETFGVLLAVAAQGEIDRWTEAVDTVASTLRYTR